MLAPPIAPMLAKLAREIPEGRFSYEPKWDGLRAIAFIDRGEIDIRSRNDRRLARYFPELVDAFRSLGLRAVIDGEIVLFRPDGSDFEALLARLHPAASRVARLAVETPAMFVAFDLLGIDDETLMDEPFTSRRRELERVIPQRRERLVLTSVVDDPCVASSWLERFGGGGIDGVVAKAHDLRYQPGVRAMVKVKKRHTAVCVAAGFRVYERTLLPSSLLLGAYDGEELRHIGIASGFGRSKSEALVPALRARIAPIETHPWRCGFGPARSTLGRLPGAASRWDPAEMDLDWTPLRIDSVCEVAYEQADRGRLRHPARFVRWRDDVPPSACSIDQLDAASPDVTELIR